jgi:hypothetical protein
LRLVNLVGHKYGFLKVVARSDFQSTRPLWICKCDCGNETVVSGGHLRDGKPKFCGGGCPLKYRGIPLESFIPPDNKHWLPVKGFEGRYWISEDGYIWGTVRAGVMKPKLSNCGYYRIMLSKLGWQGWFSVHELVAAAFIGERPEGLQINHKDGSKTNNHWANLEYVTCQQNVQHAINLGLRRKRATA